MATGRQKNAVQKAASAARVARKAVKDAEKLLRSQPTPLTTDQVEEIVERVSKKVIDTTFKQLGVHLDKDEDVDQLRKDLEYTRAWRLAIQKTGSKAWYSIVAVIATGFLAVLFTAAKFFFTGHV